MKYTWKKIQFASILPILPLTCAHLYMYYSIFIHFKLIFILIL